jgi:hypothetical protein
MEVLSLYLSGETEENPQEPSVMIVSSGVPSSNLGWDSNYSYTYPFGFTQDLQTHAGILH